MEKLIKQKLIERGFKEKTLLNNRGLINSCIEETEQQLRLYGVVSSLTAKDKLYLNTLLINKLLEKESDVSYQSVLKKKIRIVVYVDD